MKRARTIRSVRQVFNLPGRIVQVRNLPHDGFTLVEMLVSVTLVLLMMVMFGEIFQVASNSVTKQRALADNDQHARTFATVFRADLDKRSFRTLVPFFPGELASQPGTPFTTRKGYFYISCNDPDNTTDDVLQFTVLSTVSLRNSDESPYYGHAVALSGGATTQAQYQNFLNNPNQPDRDDGQITPDEAGSSRAAEVSYFMRGDKLYRRVMLVRDPIAAAGVDPADPAQPKSRTGSDYMLPANYSGNFWNDFDYSAHRTTNHPANLPAVLNARFNGMDALGNDLPAASGYVPMAPLPGQFQYIESLGQTWNRFGHNHVIVANSTFNGLPREYSSDTAGAFFLGRFVQQETSATNFLYPQALSVVAAGTRNPMDATSSGIQFTDVAPYDGIVDEFAGGSRAGVDLLLTHVHQFKVEVWDQRLGDFYPVGHSIAGGDFALGKRLNTSYGPLGGGPPRIFDTWHPNFDRNASATLGDGTGATRTDHPPFRPMDYDPEGFSAPQPTNSGGSPASKYWQQNSTYSAGDIVFEPYTDTNTNNVPDFDEKLAVNNQLKADSCIFAYQCLGRADGAAGTGLSADISMGDPVPAFSTTPRQIFVDKELKWQTLYNLRPLRAIRITVRFQHPASKQMRQVTIMHSLRDTTAVP